MNWEPAKKNEDSSNTIIPLSWLHLYYYDALNTLFRIENFLRLFVYIILKSEYHEKWIELCIKSDEDKDSSINAIAKKRMTIDKNYGYIGHPLNSPMLYLTSGELINLIISDSYWKHFKKYFLGTKEIIKNKLDEISNVRNSLAHFRPISEDDVELVKINSKHLLTEANKKLVNLLNCRQIVPSNSTDEWYKELSTIGTENIRIKFSQSTDKDWIKLKLIYLIPIVKIIKISSNRLSLIVLDLNTPNILNKFAKIKNYCISLSEDIPYLGRILNLNESIRKNCVILFNKKTLNDKFKDIKNELLNLLNSIKSEIELIKEDSLARGSLLEPKSCIAKVNSNDGQDFYTINTKNLFSIPSDLEQTEYWGNFNYYYGDSFLTETSELPWMPVSISDEDFPPF